MGNCSVVALNQAQDLPAELIRKIVEQHRYGWDEVFPIHIQDIVVADWVHMKCRYGCGCFGTNWCCPPAAPGPDLVRRFLNDYSVAMLLKSNKRRPDFYLNNKRRRATSVRLWKASVGVERLLFLEGYYKAFALVGETCSLCKTCAYPEQCRFPAEHRPSVESFSIDLFATLKHIGQGFKIAADTNDSYNHYSIVLVE